MQDAKDRLAQAAREIGPILMELERDLGVEVQGIEIERSGLVRGRGLPEITHVKVNARLHDWR